ncbi:MAG: outer membrane protein assembly factor BamD [Cytophagaceae bacterium]|nr:outer membrane protein assembly factor BamD [Cytophagaceae bacterium]
MRKSLFLFTAILLLASCSQYQKLLKSSDYDLKYEKAMEYYKAEDYKRASALLYELIGIYRGTEKSEEAHFAYANCLYGDKDYLLSGHYYQTFVQNYPTSDLLEECQFMAAYCKYLVSHNAQLDQTETFEAMDGFQLFINLYPNSPRVTEATFLMDELRNKLVYKAYLSAKLYFNMGTYLGNNYKSAVITARNILDEYPDTKYREELSFLILESKYIQAINSIEELKEERLRDAVDEYYSFVNEYPASQYLKRAHRFFEIAFGMLN